MQRNSKPISLKRVKFLSLLMLLVYAAGCNDSNDPVRVDLEPSDNDPPPYFQISYGREETQSSNGMIESIRFELSHIINGELLDYGSVSFGGVELLVYSLPGEGKFYHNYLQNTIPERPFRPEFRFDMGNLAFKALNSATIENINVELQVPKVRYLVNVSQGQMVDPNEDWIIELNQEVFAVEITLQPVEPIEGYDESDILVFWIPERPELTKTIRILASQLQAVKDQSRGDTYLLNCNYSTVADELHVRGKGSDKTIAVPVYLSSFHFIDFVMEN